MIVAGKIGRVFLLEAAAIFDHGGQGVGVNIFDTVVGIERFTSLRRRIVVTAPQSRFDVGQREVVKLLLRSHGCESESS